MEKGKHLKEKKANKGKGLIARKADVPSQVNQSDENTDDKNIELKKPPKKASELRVLDKELELAGNQYNEVYEQFEQTGDGLLQIRRKALEIIESVEGLVNSISRHPKSFEADISEIIIQKEQFKDKLVFGLEQKMVLEKTAKGAGAGIAAGAAVVSIAPSAAMWVATTFGTASTGTAISALSGAAATNAALAWLGGGAIAAGGGGMAAGNALLALAGPIGWGLAGTSIAVSVWLAWRQKHKILERKKEEIVRIKNATEELKQSKEGIDVLLKQTERMMDEIKQSLQLCNRMRGLDYRTFKNEDKHALGTCVNNTRVLSVLLNKTFGE